MCAQRTVSSCLSPSVLSSRFPQARYSTGVCLRVPIMPRKRSAGQADALCRLDSSLTPQYGSAPGLGSAETLIHRDEESSEEDRLFLPRFLLQEIILAHRPYEGVFHNRPSLQGNLLCRSDWLRLLGIAETECTILPVRELPAFPRCRVCEHLRTCERPSRRSLPAPVLLNEFRWQSDPVLWSGESSQPLLRAHRQYLRLRFGPLEIASGNGGRVVAKQRLGLWARPCCERV